MAPVPLMTIDLKTKVIREDSVGFSACRQYLVRVTLEGKKRGWDPPVFDTTSVDVKTYGDSRVVLASAQVAEDHLLLVIAYRGMPQEECYEYQHAILVPLKPW